MPVPRRRPARGLLVGPLAATVLFMALPAASASQTASEYDVKAAFLYNFTRFVEWPSLAQAPPRDAFLIGVAGDSPFGGALQEIAEQKTAHGRPIRIVPVASPADAGSVHLLFVPAEEDRRAVRLLEATRGREVLTVGETQHFLDAGGLIAFVLDSGRVRFHISDREASRTALRIGATLRRLSVSEP